MTGFSVRGADGSLYHTTTSAAARLGVSYDAAKALIASGRIASVSAESVGARVNKPGARLVSEAALAAYQRGGGATVVEMPTAVVNAGGVPVAPAGAGYVPPAQSKPKRGNFRLAGLGCLGCVGGIALILALIAIAAILGSSNSGSPSTSDLVSPCQVLFDAINAEGDYEMAALAWTVALQASDEASLGFSSARELELYRDLRDSPIGDETGRAAARLMEYCISLADE